MQGTPEGRREAEGAGREQGTAGLGVGPAEKGKSQGGVILYQIYPRGKSWATELHGMGGGSTSPSAGKPGVYRYNSGYECGLEGWARL